MAFVIWKFFNLDKFFNFSFHTQSVKKYSQESSSPDLCFSWCLCLTLADIGPMAPNALLLLSNCCMINSSSLEMIFSKSGVVDLEISM